MLWPRAYGELEPDDIYSVLGRCKLPVARNHTRPEPNSGSDCKRVGIGQGKAGLDPRRIDDLGVSVRNDLQWKCFEVTEDALRFTEGPVLGYDVKDLSDVDLVHQQRIFVPGARPQEVSDDLCTRLVIQKSQNRIGVEQTSLFLGLARHGAPPSGR